MALYQLVRVWSGDVCPNEDLCSLNWWTVASALKSTNTVTSAYFLCNVLMGLYSVKVKHFATGGAYHAAYVLQRHSDCETVNSETPIVLL